MTKTYIAILAIVMMGLSPLNASPEGPGATEDFEKQRKMAIDILAK